MKRLACALLAAVLCACAHIEPAESNVAAAPSGGDALTSYLESLHGMSDARLATEAARQRRLADRDGDDLSRVRAALALSLAPHGDEGDILALVEPVAGHPRTAGEVRAMASFLQAMALERRKLRESAAAAGAKLREERNAREQERLRAEAQQQRATELQQKLDALSELEKSLSNRPPASR